MFRVIPISAIVFLVGCVSDTEQLNLDREKCISYGYKNNANKLADCIKDLQLQRELIDNNNYRDMKRENNRMVFGSRNKD